MEQRTEKTTHPVGGINLDLGILQLKIDLTVSGIRTVTDTLETTLQETQGTLSENVVKLVDAVGQLGVENLVRWAGEGGEEAKRLFDKLVGQLKEAARRGSEEAGELTEKLGRKMQGAAEPH